MQDLNELTGAAEAGWVLNSARAINASGQIVGFGTYKGETAAFLLTPTASAKANVRRPKTRTPWGSLLASPPARPGCRDSPLRLDSHAFLCVPPLANRSR